MDRSLPRMDLNRVRVRVRHHHGEATDPHLNATVKLRIWPPDRDAHHLGTFESSQRFMSFLSVTTGSVSNPSIPRGKTSLSGSLEHIAVIENLVVVHNSLG